MRFHRSDRARSGCKHTVNYPKAGKCSRFCSAEDGGQGCHKCGIAHTVWDTGTFHHLSTAALEGFTPINHQRMRVPDRSSLPCTTQQMWNGLIGSPERWRTRWGGRREEEEWRHSPVRSRGGEKERWKVNSVYTEQYEVTGKWRGFHGFTPFYDCFTEYKDAVLPLGFGI